MAARATRKIAGKMLSAVVVAPDCVVVTFRTLCSHLVLLEVLAVVNRGLVLAVCHVAVEEGLGGALINETSGDGDVTLPLVDRHGAGLNDGLACKIAPGGHECPGAVQGGVIARKGRECEQESRQHRLDFDTHGSEVWRRLCGLDDGLEEQRLHSFWRNLHMLFGRTSRAWQSEWLN